MDQMFKPSKKAYPIPFLPMKHWQLLIASLGVVIIASFWPEQQQQAATSRQSLQLPGMSENEDGTSYQLKQSLGLPQVLSTKPSNAVEPSVKSLASADGASPEPTSPLSIAPVIVPEPVAQAHSHSYHIAKGDTLSKIFEKLNISQQTMYQVLEADLNVLALDTLSLGHELKFEIDEQQKLQKLTLFFNPAQQIIFSRVDENNFEYETISLDGQWKQQAVQGEIHGSFYVSATKAGLSPAEIQQVTRLFKDKLRFSRDLRAGDQFHLVRNRQYIDNETSGISEISAIVLKNRGREFSAYLYSDGNYYDANGESLARAFMRVPLKHNYRVSSKYNPRRRHPVTGRISPHNGTDFATPIGTPVLAAGDGIVTRIENHRYAGKYLVIDHGGKYRTRYLHLNQFKVRKGDAVKRGDTVALSGNTGRSTGPHLHYELHINGHPVDPMRAKIPLAQAIDAEQSPAFKAFVSKMNQLMM